METYSITKTIIHPQCGAPMEFHRITRVEVDMSSNNTYVVFSSFYNEAAFTNGSMPMSVTSVHLIGSKLLTEQGLVQAVIDNPDNELSGGEVDINEIPEGIEDEPGMP